MKYKKAAALAAAVLMLSGCQSSKTEVNTETVNEEQAADETVESEDSIDKTITALFDQNVYCMTRIFGACHLPYEGEPVEGDNIYKVNSEFSGYSEFEEYIRGVYAKDEADRLLYDCPYEGEPMYVNVDGMLCININLAGAKGYYVDWKDCDITVNSADGEKCSFTVRGSIEEPAAVPEKKDYYADGSAVFENGQWLLEKVIY